MANTPYQPHIVSCGRGALAELPEGATRGAHARTLVAGAVMPYWSASPVDDSPFSQNQRWELRLM